MFLSIKYLLGCSEKSSFQIFYKNSERNILHEEELCWSKYIPFCSTILAHLSKSCMMLLFQNEGLLLAKNWSRWLLTSKDSNFLSKRKFSKERNRYSDGVRLEEYRGWRRTSHSKSNSTDRHCDIRPDIIVLKDRSCMLENKKMRRRLQRHF